MYFANGGSVYLHQQLDMAVDGLSIGDTPLYSTIKKKKKNGNSFLRVFLPPPPPVDWKISMARARELAGPSRVLAGNVDPMHLYGR